MLSSMKQEENASVTKNSNMPDYPGKDGGQQLQYPPNHYVDANGNIKYFTRQGSYPIPSNQFKQFYPPPQQTLIKQQQLKLQRMQSQQAQMQQNQPPQMQSSQSQPPQMQQQQMPLQQQQLPLQQQQMPMQQQQQQQQQQQMPVLQQPKPFQQQMMQPQQLQQMRPQPQQQQQQQQIQQRLSYYDNPPAVPQAMEYYNNGSYSQNQQYQQMDNMANGSYAQQMNQPQQDYYQPAAPMTYQLDTNQYLPQSNYYQCNQQQRNVVYDNAGMYQQAFNNQYQTDYYKMYNSNNAYGFDQQQQQQQQDFPSETEMSNVEYHQGGASNELVGRNCPSGGCQGTGKELVHPKETFEKLCQNIPLCKTCAEIIRHHFYANGDLDEVKKLAETSKSDGSLGRREEAPTKETAEAEETGESEAASGGESEANAAAGGDSDSAIYEGHPSKKETPSVHNFVEDKCSRCGGWTLVQKEDEEQ